MTDDLGVIRVGLSVGMGTLDRDLANIQKKISPIEAEHTIPFKVGGITGLTQLKREIETVTKGRVPITINVGIPKGAGAAIKRDLASQLKDAGPIKVTITPNLSRAEINRMRSEISTALSNIPVTVAVTGAAGGGGGQGAAPAAPAAPTGSGGARTTRTAPSRPSRAAGTASSAPAAPPVVTASPQPMVMPSGPDWGVPSGPASQVRYTTNRKGVVTARPGRMGPDELARGKSIDRSQPGFTFRGSGPFKPSIGFGENMHPGLRKGLDVVQFYKYSPILGEAFDAFQGGDFEMAKGILKGFATQLKGRTPGQQRRFFRLFKNVEKVPDELLFQDAAFRALLNAVGTELDPDWAHKVGADYVPSGPKKASGRAHSRDNIMRDLEQVKTGKLTYDEFWGRYPGARPEGKFASGGHFQTPPGGATITVGEAAGEEVAILKNPIRYRLGGRFSSAQGASGFAQDAGIASPVGVGGIQRVFVTNWPSGGGLSRAFGVAGVSGRSGADIQAEKAAALDELLRNTRTATVNEPQAESLRAPALTPEEKFRSRSEAIGGAGPREIRQQLTAIRSGLSETQSQSPVRSLAPAFGQIVATRFGRGELLNRLAVARDLANQAARAEGLYSQELRKEQDIQTALDKEEDPEKKKALTDALGEQRSATEAARKETASWVTQAAAAADHADALSLKLGTLAGNTLGIIGGTLAFGATLGLAQAGLSAVGQVLGPIIERMSGFQNVTAQVTSNLADQTRQQQGAVKATIAQAEAQAGLGQATSATISPLLEQRAQTEAGNKALGDALNLLHAFETIRAQNAGRGGADQGLTSTTGGFFGTLLNGIPSTSELVGNELANVTQAGQDRSRIPQLQAARAALGSNPTGRQAQAAQALDRQIAALGGGFDVGADRMAFFNDQIQKGGQSFKFVAQNAIKLDATTREDAAKAADLAGAFDIANNIRDQRSILVDALGNVVTTADGFTDALSAINKGLTTPDIGNLLKQLTERQIPAQRGLIRAQGQFERQFLNPAQLALQEAANPTPGVNGLNGQPSAGFGEGIIGKGDQAAKAAAGRYQGIVAPAIDYVNEQIAKGHEALLNLVPPDLRNDFTSLLSDISATGAQIQKIQLGLSQQAVNLDVAQYNEQLRIARRSLQDAKDLQAGIGGATRDTLGGIEGQNIAIQRQLQLLGFELQQRQINYKVALAGFVAPGSTPQERAARIEEAKTEAAYAQKQLDLQKQLANNEFKGVRITADRNVTDLFNQIALLEQGRELTINTAAANRAIDVLSKKLNYEVAQAQSMVNEGVKVSQAAMDAAAEATAATGKAYGYILSQTAKAWGIFGDQANSFISALTQGVGIYKNDSSGLGDRAHKNSGGNARGTVGLTHGKTSMIMGEAMGEAYAILKDPKLVPTPDVGGGGGGIAVSFGDINISIEGGAGSSEDKRRMAQEVADEVVDILSAKLALIQSRPAFG